MQISHAVLPGTLPSALALREARCSLVFGYRIPLCYDPAVSLLAAHTHLGCDFEYEMQL